MWLLLLWPNFLITVLWQTEKVVERLKSQHQVHSEKYSKGRRDLSLLDYCAAIDEFLAIPLPNEVSRQDAAVIDAMMSKWNKTAKARNRKPKVSCI